MLVGSEHKSAPCLDATHRKAAPGVGQATRGQVGKGTRPVTGPAGPTGDGNWGTEVPTARRPPSRRSAQSCLIWEGWGPHLS